MMRYSSVGLLSLLFLTTVNISGVPTSPQPQHKQTCNTIDKQNPINSETKNLRASPPLMVKNFITVNSQSLPNISAVPLSPVGAMGTTQYIIGTNDGIRSYSRATGVADQALNSSLTAFFQLSSIPAGIEIGVQIKFDRFSNRWFVLGAADPFVGPFPMTLFLATSNSDVITSCSTWSISTIVVDPSGNNFINEVPSLGIDSNAVYIGINLYNNNTGNFTGSNAYVLPKNTNLYAGTPDVYTFTNVGTPTGGMFTPIGVDNFDTDPEFGYFVGVDVVDLSSMIIQRVINPGTTPSLAPAVNMPIPLYATPLLANYDNVYGAAIGITASLNFFENVAASQLFSAHIRNGQLFTVQTVAVDETGVSTGTPDRDAARWYQLNLIGNDPVEGPATVPTVTLGTLFDDAITNQQFFYWPAIMTNNAGLMTIAGNVSSLTQNINAYVADRAITDPVGPVGDTDLRNSIQLFTNNSPASYILSGAVLGFQFWGYSSQTSPDPINDKNMWTIQQFVSSFNNRPYA